MARKIAWGAVGICLLAGGVGFLRMIGQHGLGGGRASREHNSSSALKTLTSAEADFQRNDRDRNGSNDYWVGDVSRLRYLEAGGAPLELIERSLAAADAAPLKPNPDPNPYAGYHFTTMKTDETGAPYDRGGGRNPDKYAFCAYPAEYIAEPTWMGGSNDVSRYTFIVNEANVIWRKDLHASPVFAWPKDLLAEGWSRLD